MQFRNFNKEQLSKHKAAVAVLASGFFQLFKCVEKLGN